jgi:hypothetical protein
LGTARVVVEADAAAGELPPTGRRLDEQFGRRIFDDVIVSTDRRILGERTTREG